MAQNEIWHQRAKNDAHVGVFQAIRYIATQQSEQREDVLHYMSLYSAGNISGLGDGISAIADQLAEYMYRADHSTRFNLCAAVVDTACSLIAQSPVVPMVLTTMGDFGLIRKAERRTQVLQGQLNRDRQEIIKRVFLDAAKTGTGLVFGYHDPLTGLPEIERVHMLEMFVEHLDGAYGKPRSMHRRKLVPKAVLAGQFPKYATQIEMAACVEHDSITDFLLANVTGDFHDFVEVVESWCLRTSRKGSKGRHTICIPNLTLLDESYQHDKHPFVVIRYRDRDFGFWGAGLVESVRYAQNRINDLIARVSRAQDLGSTMVILNPNGENSVRKEEFSNDLGLVLNYDPLVGPPQLVTWNGTMDDLQQQIDLEYQRALLVEGLSQEQVNGQGAGRGLESGVAVRAADDVQSRRLVPYVSRYQQGCLEIARLFERLNDDAAARDPDFSIMGESKAGARTFLRTSKWADLDIPVGHANVTMSQMSALPTTPAGRWAAAIDWVQSGFISKTYALDLMGMPDIDTYAAIENAHIDLAKWQVERILDGEMVEPIPRQDLTVAMDLATRSELQAMVMGAAPEVIDGFEAFLTYCQQMLDKATAQAAPPAPTGPTPTPVAGGAPMPELAPAMQMAPPPQGTQALGLSPNL
jgi:hypothetical protein